MDHLEISLTCKKFTTFCPHLLFENPENLELHSPLEPRRFMGRFACLGMSASPACAVEIVAEMSLGCVGKIRAFSVHESRVVDCWPFFFFAVIHRQ